LLRPIDPAGDRCQEELPQVGLHGQHFSCLECHCRHRSQESVIPQLSVNAWLRVGQVLAHYDHCLMILWLHSDPLLKKQNYVWPRNEEHPRSSWIE
jgi:hypothetical protein